jgi:hypothetical protein
LHVLCEQTGTGKTHTILGAPGDEGLLPRLIGDVFDFANVSGGLANEVKVACYMLELYQVHRDSAPTRSEFLLPQYRSPWPLLLYLC